MPRSRHHATRNQGIDFNLFEAAAAQPGLELLPWLEQEFTRRAMESTGNNQLRAAKLLGITRATLRKRLEHLRGALA